MLPSPRRRAAAEPASRATAPATPSCARPAVLRRRMDLEDPLCQVDPNDRSFLHACLLRWGWSCNTTSVARFDAVGRGHPPHQNPIGCRGWRAARAPLAGAPATAREAASTQICAPLSSVNLRPARAARRSDSRAGKWLHWHDLDADGPARCGTSYCLLRGINAGYAQERERTGRRSA